MRRQPERGSSRWLRALALSAGLVQVAACSGATTDARAVTSGADRPLPADAEVRRDDARGTIRLLRAPNLSASLESAAEFRALQSANRFADVAMAFLDAHRGLFGLANPSAELSVRSVTTDDLALKHVRLQQRYEGLPVWAAELNVHLDRDNHVYLAQGRYIRTPLGLATTPRLPAEQARQRAAAAVSGAAPDCPGCRSELLVFVAADERPRLAHRVLVEVAVTNAWAVTVDADSGAILEKITTVVHR